MPIKHTMIPADDLKTIALERLTDAEKLLEAKRFDSAIYLCGYCMEIYLKHKICMTLNWPGFPSTGKEFENFKSLRTHDLGVLLSLSGCESFILKEHLHNWSPLLEWNPEHRYRLVGTVREEEAIEMIESVKFMLKIL